MTHVIGIVGRIASGEDTAEYLHEWIGASVSRMSER